jgi:hypothetical protein
VQIDFLRADLSAFPALRAFGGEDAMSFLPGGSAMKAAAFGVAAMFGVIALLVLIGGATPVGAAPFNAKAFFEQQQRWGGGGGSGGGGM